MDVAALAVVAVVAIAAGAVIGFVARGFWANQAIKAAQEKAARIVAEARTQQKDLILEAKDEKLRLQRDVEEEAKSKRSELLGLEKRLLTRDEQLDQRADLLQRHALHDAEHERDPLLGLEREQVRERAGELLLLQRG